MPHHARIVSPMCLLTIVFTLSGAHAADPAPDASSLHWYKGNTHTHTVLCGHADTSPEAVAKWYLDRDYNFLCLSEHNRFINPADVALPADRRKDFILVPSEEITGTHHIHTSAVNIDGLVDWTADDPDKSVIVDKHAELTRLAGGVPILNHPNFQWALTSDDIRPAKHLHHFELFNGHPSVHNFGDGGHPTTEEMWDALLTNGMAMYGVSSDDAHTFQKFAPKESNPGRGWIMVRAKELSPGAIADAMERGDFYATNGVMLKTLSTTDGVYAVAVDEAATEAALKSEFVIGKAVTGDGDAKVEPGCVIDFVGPEGKVLQSVRGVASRFDITKDHAYIRCRISWTRKSDAGFEVFYAWTQPVFTDGRLERAGQ
ncbi:MAG: hypothetical protein GC159_16530 [Phycisphaera sp.]|nr:hypothetical protein [Phycisphaera sp.]